MYGFADKAKVERAVMAIRQHYPKDRLVVQPHSWNIAGKPLTWGVARYVPYCENMPEKFDGFIWFMR